MAKSRRNRARAGVRNDPLARPVKPPTDPELAALREEKILPILKDLRSTDTKTRSLAATAILNVVDDDKCRRLLLREGLLRILMEETLTDASPDGRATGWEIIKSVAEKEDPGFCVHLYRQDILTAIEFAAKTLSETLDSTGTPFHRTSNAQQSLVWRITISICSLLGALGEAQDEILESITKNTNITSFLTSLLSREIIDRDALDECLTCVMILTEDNRPLAEALVGTPAYDLLMKQRKLDGTTSVLVCGVLNNIFSAMEWDDNTPGKDGATDELLIRRLARTLQDYKPGVEPDKDAEWTCPDEIASLVLEILASIASGVQDTLTSGKKSTRQVKDADSEPEDDERMDVEDDKMEEDDGSDDEALSNADDDESDGELNGSDLEDDMAMVTGGGDEESGIEDLPTLGSLLRKAIPQVLRLASPSAQSGSPSDVQIHAISVLNNLSWSIACLDFADGHNEALLKTWVPYGAAIWENVVTEILDSDTNDLALATEVTGLAWALSKSLGAAHLPLKEGQHQKFIALYHATKTMPQAGEEAPAGPEDPFQALGVKCIGVLGQLAADPAPLPLNRDIGVFLLTAVSSLPQTSPAEAVEALNQIFEVYGDEEAACEEVFWADGFLKHLEEALPKGKTMLKSIHKTDPKTKELRERAEEAILNLGRFVQYKRKLKPRK
ncbi:uncharacterized protein DNG_01620 [Cephalotrichum gorgonifer]|uniref:SYO1-like TPR repeats domain-containing protein n=1 Tax=Cephalotrichum gorgonifer TaxID=2041049 RepID=A0AAE8MS22_9PEZI|nr:uncharacterized protein DNG_01620 [Cephalotrichum gorgonifer]